VKVRDGKAFFPEVVMETRESSAMFGVRQPLPLPSYVGFTKHREFLTYRTNCSER